MTENNSQSIDSNLSRKVLDQINPYKPKKRWHKWVIRRTLPVWKPFLVYVFWRLYDQEVIDSSRMHLIFAAIEASIKGE